jgi:hypothetical protein
MRDFKAVLALLALITIPAVAAAADDVAALRAELQALKNDYGARVDALETHQATRNRQCGRGRCGRGHGG